MRKSKNLNILRVAIIVGLILLIPLVATNTVEGWNWTFFDFVVMGALLFAAGLALEFTVKMVNNPMYRIIGCVVIVAVFLLIWAGMVHSLWERLAERLFKVFCGGAC